MRFPSSAARICAVILEAVAGAFERDSEVGGEKASKQGVRMLMSPWYTERQLVRCACYCSGFGEITDRGPSSWHPRASIVAAGHAGLALAKAVTGTHSPSSPQSHPRDTIVFSSSLIVRFSSVRTVLPLQQSS